MGAGIVDLGLQSKILMRFISNLYQNKKFDELASVYDSLDIDQVFVKEVLQEMELLYTSSKSKQIKKTFDKIDKKSKSSFTRFWKVHSSGRANKNNIDSIKLKKKNNKKQTKVK